MSVEHERVSFLRNEVKAASARERVEKEKIALFFHVFF
jgi:hypothetical protein